MNSLVVSHPHPRQRGKDWFQFSRAILIITAISTFGLCVLPGSRAQGIPLRPGHLDGEWININLGMVGVIKIEIHGTEVELFGNCKPTPCDWGVATARGYASSVQSSEITALFLHRVTHFNEVEIAIDLGNNGLLRVETFTHFTDSSRRADYSRVEYFDRNRAPDNP